MKILYETGKGLKFAEEDVFNEGCLPETASSHMIDVSFKAETKKEVIEKIKEFFDVDADAIESNSCEEAGRIDIMLLENTEGIKANESEIKDWKNAGCTKLYNCIYSFQLEKVTRETISI